MAVFVGESVMGRSPSRDGQAVQKISDLDAALDKHKVGDTVTLTIERDSKKQDEGDAERGGVRRSELRP